MKITRLYNERLQIWAAANDCPVVNVESDVIDPLTQEWPHRFRRADPDDIHYADDAWDLFWANALASSSLKSDQPASSIRGSRRPMQG